MSLFRALTIVVLLGLLPCHGVAQTSLQARIDNATRGDTVVVAGGTHHGPFVIDRPIALVGTNGAHLKGDEQAHVVTITADDVALEGFRITGSGTQLEQDHAGVMVKGHRATLRENRLADVLHGIYVKGKDRTVITRNIIEGPPTAPRRVTQDEAARYDGCSVPATGGTCEVPLVSAQRGNGIHLWNALHSRLTHNTVRRTRDGIYFSHSDETHTAHNRIEHVRYGLHFMYSDDNHFSDNVFAHNVSGSALMYSARIDVRNNDFRDNRTKNGYGLLLQSVDQSTFTDNRLVGNMTGLYLENSSANTFQGNTVRSNFRGMRLTGSSTNNSFSRNVVQANLQTAQLSGVSATNSWSIDGVGNFWGTRGLVDVNADGISEMPWRVVDVLGTGANDFPYAGLLATSPGVQTLSFALRRAPLPGVPQILDPHPLMRPRGNGQTGMPGWLALMMGGLAVALILIRRPNA